MRRSTSLRSCRLPLLLLLVSCGASEGTGTSGEPIEGRSAPLGLGVGGLRPSASSPASASRLALTGEPFRAIGEGFRARAHGAVPTAIADASGVGFELSDSVGRVGLSTRSVSCGDGALTVADAPPRRRASTTDAVVWARRAGEAAFDEWLVDAPTGLEHGYTFEKHPCANGGELVLAVEPEGLRARQAGADVELVDARSVVRARYAGLHAEDDAGRPLGASLRVASERRIEIRIDVAHATWPVTIDPVVTTPAPALVAADGAADDSFGVAVVVAKDAAFVGAPAKTVGAHVGQGAVYVFQRTSGVWSQKAVLTAADGADDDAFGRSVALAGDLLVVGAPGRAAGTGAAYVFTNGAAGWSQSGGAFVSSDAAVGDSLGASVAASVDEFALGAPTKTVAGRARQGAAYVFMKIAGVWKQASPLLAGDAAANDQFGYSVGIDVTTLVVGAPVKSVAGHTRQGAAYVFGFAASTWTQVGASLVGAGGAANDGFGTALSLSGGTLLIGAPGATVGANAAQGAFYWFATSASGFAQQATPYVASDGAAGDRFGSAIALHGVSAVVSAPTKAVAGKSGQGAAYLFARAGAGWSAQGASLVAADGAADDSFGAAAALSDDTLLLGAPNHGVGANPAQGVAYPINVQGLLGATCATAADCASAYQCNGGHCSLACQVCPNGDPAACDPQTGTACDDGDACTRTDVCFNGACQGKNVNLCECFTGGSCSPATGSCSGTKVADGTACGGGTCAAGVCVANPDAGPDAADTGGSDGATDAADSATDAADATTDAADSATAPDAATDGAVTDALADTEAPLPAPKGDSGCSCDAPGARAPHAYAPLAALGLALALLRRRRAR